VKGTITPFIYSTLVRYSGSRGYTSILPWERTLDRVGDSRILPEFDTQKDRLPCIVIKGFTDKMKALVAYNELSAYRQKETPLSPFQNRGWL
jgi:hypothetical protein